MDQEMNHREPYLKELALLAQTSQQDFIQAEAAASQNPSFTRDLSLLGFRVRAIGYEAKHRIAQRAQRVIQTNEAPQ